MKHKFTGIIILVSVQIELSNSCELYDTSLNTVVPFRLLQKYKIQTNKVPYKIQKQRKIIHLLLDDSPNSVSF